MRRRLFLYAASLAAGIFSYEHGAAVCIAAAAAIVLLCTASDGGRKKTLLRAALLFFVLGIAACLIQDMELSSSSWMDDAAGETHLVRVTDVSRINDEKYRIKGRVTLCGIGSRDERESSARVLFTYHAALDSPYELIGETIEAKADIDAPESADNPRCFDYARYLKGMGISHCAALKSFRVTDRGRGILYGLRYRLTDVRERFLESLDVSDRARQFIRGFLFGDTQSMDEDMREAFRANGTAHVLAVSGLHIGLIYGLFKALKRRSGKKWPNILFAAFMLVYGTMTLWAVSVTRAVLMVFADLFAEKLSRRYDMLSVLSGIGIAILLVRPYMLWSASMQMSFLAVISMTFIGKALRDARRVDLGSGAQTMLSVQCGMLPYTASVFNGIPFAAFIANIPVIALLSALVPLALLLLVAFMAHIAPAWPAVRLLGALSDLTVSINSFIARRGLFCPDVISPPLALTAGVYAAAMFFTGEAGRIAFIRKDAGKIARFAAVGILCVLIAGIADFTPFDRADAVFVSVGQGDCLHIKAGSEDILIDGGGSTDRNIGKDVLRPYLLKNRVRDVDLALATHLHTDHYLGLTQLAECYDVEKIVTSGKAGDRIEVSKDCSLQILWPERPPDRSETDDSEDENLNSLIFMAEIRGLRILVTGDITSEGEKMLLDKYRGSGVLKADVLKVAHHGSRYSTSEEFLEEVSPKVAVISVGRKNMYGHPTPEVIERLEKHDIIVYRTDLDGAVGVRKKGDKIAVCVQKRGKARAVSRNS